MKKKIDLFWYWFILVVSFVLCFFAVNDKKVNAYSLDSNGNIVSDNIFTNNYAECGYSYITNCSLHDENIYVYVDVTAVSPNGYTIITKDIRGLIETGVQYTFTIFTENNSDYFWFRLFDSSNTDYSGAHSFTKSITYTFNDNRPLYLAVYTSDQTLSYSINGIMITKGSSVPSIYEPGGIWYNESYAEDKFVGRLPSFTSSLTYTNQDNGVTSIINDVNSYIDNSFGYLYFDRLWNYLDSLTSSSYDNAKLTIIFNDNLNINTSYIINSNKENYGSGVWFYQNNDLMLDVRNFLDNEYCAGSSQYSCNVELNKYVNVGSGVNSFSYLNKIVVWSSSTDERTLAFGYNNIGYNTGYDNGYTNGYNDGKKVADDLIYDNGYTNGYNVGYDNGINYASNGGNTLVGLVGAVFTAPVNMLHTIFDFEFLGINLTNFLFSLISLFIVIWLIRKFL